MSKAHNHSIARKSLIRTILFVVFILLAGSSFEAYNQAQLALVLILFIGVLSVTLLTGISGQLSLGQGALMAVGGYSMALLMTNNNYSLWVAIPLAIVGASLAGLLLGISAARLTGPYLAGTTLVIALAIPTLANRFMSVLKGDEGLPVDVGYPPVWFTNLFGEPSYEQWQLYVALPFAAIALFFASNILLSRTGRMWRAIRDNETAAALSGLNTGRMKVMAFALSSGMAGLAGGLLVMLISGVSPSAFPLSLSFSLLTGAVVTGIYSLRGVMLGGLVLVAIPEIADSLVTRIGGSEGFTATLPGFLVSALLILAVLFAPNGPGTLMHRFKKHN